MNVYKIKRRWQLVLFIAAILIGMASLLYTNQMVGKMARQERLKAEMLADAWSQIVNAGDEDVNLDFFAGVIENNETIPVIVTDSTDRIILTRNLDTARLSNPHYISVQLAKMKAHAPPVVIPLPPSDVQYLYYNQSILLTRLQFYPYLQLAVVLVFIFVAWLAFRISRKFEDNQIWVGLTRETAHQLGTPISSLIAWVEMMRIRNSDQDMLIELEKDVARLEKITERFSKIGSKPVMTLQDVGPVITTAVNYVRSRSSGKVKFTMNMSSEPVLVPLNAALFEWVIENLCKNAIDAMQGEGRIDIDLYDRSNEVQIDIKDNGKGIPKSMFKTVFRPGYTTKKKGWGLGLSLVKRIVEEYHEGRIFVQQSDINKGTVFTIVIKKL